MTAIYIIADIEGSSGCNERTDAQLFNDGWVRACVALSHDINAIGKSLLAAGIERVRVKDFHRTGYNIFGELLDEKIEIDQGYNASPIPGIGKACGFELLYMTGMHAASGLEGFIPHTLTSKFATILVNGRHLTEAELFASSVAKTGLVPAFFSGCEIACRQAHTAISGLQTFTINKPLSEPAETIRANLAAAAVKAISAGNRQPFTPSGPFAVVIKMRDGNQAAEKLRKTWCLDGSYDELLFDSPDMESLYWQLIRIAYLNPFAERHLNSALTIANISGRLAHLWARRRAKSLKLL